MFQQSHCSDRRFYSTETTHAYPTFSFIISLVFFPRAPYEIPKVMRDLAKLYLTSALRQPSTLLGLHVDLLNALS